MNADPRLRGVRAVPYRGPIPSDRTLSVQNYPAVRQALADGFSRMCILLRNNRAALLELFGRQNRTHRREYAHYVWVLSRDGLTYHVYTGNRGTSYELDLSSGEAPTLPRPEVETRVVRFLLALHRAILSTDDGRRESGAIRAAIRRRPQPSR